MKPEDFTCLKAVGCFEMSIFGEKHQDIFEKESQRIFLVERLVKSRMPDRLKRKLWGIHRMILELGVGRDGT